MRLATVSLFTVAAAAVFLPSGLVAQDAQAEAIERGRLLFDKAFSQAEGLGAPTMNADSCRACHADPAMGGAGGLELNVSRFGFDNGGAGPFQDLTGGQGLSKLFPPMTAGREEHPPEADVFEQRQTPSIFGAGLIDQIPGSVITANEDVLDANNDGIFGVARRITVQGAIEIGRFGWKGQVPRLADFVNDAMMGELGVTTPDNGRGFAGLADPDPVADPEISQQDVDDMAAFLASLPAPARGGSTDPQVAVGETLFTQIGCATCHIPSLPGPNGPVRLFSNLLLHNVMPPGFRGMVEPDAGSGVFRTPPLWGIKDTAPYMHDGRAEDLVGAINAHFSEAEQVKQDYLALTADEQAALILFLEDL